MADVRSGAGYRFSGFTRWLQYTKIGPRIRMASSRMLLAPHYYSQGKISMAIIQSRRILTAAIVAALGASASLHAQTFYQNFDIADPMNPRPGCNTGDFPGGAGTYPFPSGWLKRNVDNLTPNAAVAYVNEAWEVREDFSFNVSECAAFSTSWYSPAGAANDWMWTPAISIPAGSATLSWRAVAYDPSYPDGYEVRAMLASSGPPTGGTGTIGNQITNSTALFSVAAEQSAWTPHAVSLASFTGQQIYVGFHNNSNDKFLLVVDDVKVLDSTPNLAAIASTFSSPYPRVAAGIAVDARFAVNAANIGGMDLTNVIATASIKRDGKEFGSPIVSNTIASLPIGATQTVTFPIGYTFSGNGVWSIEYSLSSSQSASELSLLDNVIDSAPTAIGGNEFARHELPSTSTLGIGAGNGGEIGVQFELLASSTFEGVRFAMNAVPPAVPPDLEWAGQDIIANLRAFDTVTGKPGNLIASTSPVVSTNAGGTSDAPFVGGSQLLPAGSYVITVSEPVGGPAMPLFMTSQRYQAGAGWVIWPTAPAGGWANIESFGSAFTITPDVSLLSENSLFKDGFETVGSAAVAAHTAIPMRPAKRSMPTQLAPRPPR